MPATLVTKMLFAPGPTIKKLRAICRAEAILKPAS
jgi:hypothetical protein